MTKIAIDIQSCHGNLTGLGVYTNHLVEFLSAEKPSDIKMILLRRSKKGNLNTLQRLLWENIELSRQVRQEKVDLLHVPAFSPPMIRPCRHLVVTLHDLIGMTFPNQKGIASSFYWRTWMPQRVKHADWLIVPSLHTKNDVIKYLNYPEKRIRMVYLSGHESFSLQKNPDLTEKISKLHGINPRYFLAVGTLEPRKNLELSLEGFSRFCAKYPSESFQLVLVGSLDFAHGQFADQLRKKYKSILNRLVFTGYVDHETLNQLYSNARAFLFPSLYEGFGIPILEAMASGTPVVTSNLTSLPEIAGDAAFYVNAYEPDSMAAALEKISTDDSFRQELIQKGLNRIQLFSWRKCAAETLQVYRDCLAGVSA